MKQLLIKLAKAFLIRQGYVVRSKAECSLVPNFILDMQGKIQRPEPVKE